MTDNVIAAIDASKFAHSVCDCAIWASQKLGSPLVFLHVVDNHPQAAEADLTGNIGLGSREHLLEELSGLDEKRAKIAQESGRVILKAAKERAETAGASNASTRQRNGTLVETLEEMQGETRLLVIGKRGANEHHDSEHLGSNLERVVRSLHHPVLMVPATFTTPKKILVAFDGSKTTRKGIEVLAKSPLFAGTAVHVVIVGSDTGDNRYQLDWALGLLREAGHSAEGTIRAGEVEATLHDYQRKHDIDLLVMGAYGHSRIRHLLVGSTTSEMLRKADIPLLILR
ncbi:universal stress protein [Salinicola sp. JS01]|uniref:universal stress protein n=1 Tax=Salinicola sp. JS01 TaxID=3050071 RepID=UPI00255B6CD5|nr:universal stress protein [Salinicola sp. JS01]WIX33272.1 universal stress protein [Salinicola sp. JS01]